MFDKSPSQPQSISGAQIAGSQVQQGQARQILTQNQIGNLSANQQGITEAEVVKLLESLEETVKAAKLSDSIAEEALDYLKPAKREAGKENADKNFIAQNLKRQTFWKAIETQPEMQTLLHPDSERKPGILLISLFLKIAAEVYKGYPFSSKVELLKAYIDQRLKLEVKAWERGNPKNRKWAYQTIAKEPDWRKTWHYLSWLSQKLEQTHQAEFLAVVWHVFNISPYVLSSALLLKLLPGTMLSFSTTVSNVVFCDALAVAIGFCIGSC
ncbi:MAG: hypothetical protein MJA27_30635 [Pseudanabaenales cyanobacterium]|nr:hypothetical protein [Pseudanabaenales cyanobacterium]